MHRRPRVLVVLPVLLAALSGVAVVFMSGCSWGRSESNEEGEAARTARVRVVFSRDTASGAWFGLDDDTPAFLGLSARTAEGDFAAARAVGESAETTLEVPVGRKISFRSTLVAAKEGDGYLYHSQATKDVVVEADTAEIVLSFVPYKPVKPINVYGLVHSDKLTPAAGAQVRILDPYTEAPIQAPGTASFAVTDARGTFAGRFPFDAYPGLDKVTLEITHAGKTSAVSVPFKRPAAPGLTLPFVNLATGGQDVVPRFSRADDFDGDGTPNAFELASGTNPFSELSGARGKEGPATLVSATSATTAQCAAGGVVIQYHLDVDGSLTVNTGDTPVGTSQILCNGLPGAQGPAGAPGADGTAGAALKVRRRDSGAELPLVFIPLASPTTAVQLSTLTGKRFWYDTNSFAPMNLRNCHAPLTFSGGAQWYQQCGSFDLPWPWASQFGRCYFSDTTCTSPTCLIAARPEPSALFVFTMSGGNPGGFMESPATVAPVSEASFPSGGSYIEFYQDAKTGCLPASFSPGTTFTGSFYTLSVVGAPAGITFPLPPFYIAP